MKNPTIQQNCRNSWTSNAILMSFKIKNLFYDWKHHFKPLGRGGAVKIFSQTMSHLMNDKAVYRTAPATPGLLITALLAFSFCNLPGSAMLWSHFRLPAFWVESLGVNCWVVRPASPGSPDLQLRKYHRIASQLRRQEMHFLQRPIKRLLWLSCHNTFIDILAEEFVKFI